MGRISHFAVLGAEVNSFNWMFGLFSLLFSFTLFFFYFFFELAGLLLRALSNSKPFDVGYEAGSGNMACFVHVALLCEFGCGCLQHHSLWSLSAPGQDG